MQKKILLFLIFFLFSCENNYSSSEISSMYNSSSNSKVSSLSSNSSSVKISNISSSFSIISQNTSSSSSSNSSSSSSSSSSSTSSSSLIMKEVDIDSTKEQFKFNQDLKYNDLHNELNKKNFTLNIEVGSRETYQDETVIYTPSMYETLAIDDGVFYHKIDYIEEYPILVVFLFQANHSSA